MDILFLLLPIALIVATVLAAFFLWSVRSGQYDDLDGAAHRILMDDDEPQVSADHQIRNTTANKPNQNQS